MTPTHPHPPATPPREGSRGGALPTLQLPPVPFAQRTSAAPAASREPLPSGTAVEALLGELSALPVATYAPLPAAQPTPLSAPASPRPHGEFRTDVERRRADRRRTPRHGSDRRAYASSNLAAPHSGPLDPRPIAPPPEHEPRRVGPMDTRLPELPPTEALEPARPYVPAPPAPPAAETVAAAEHPAPAPMPAPAPAPVPVAPLQLDAIYGLARNDGSVPVGRLDPWPTQTPLAGPSGPALAPGAGLDPTVATAAAAPSAWYGGRIEVDDAMLVWNAPGVQPNVFSTEYTDPALRSAAPGPGLALTAMPAAPAPAGAATRSPGAALLRLLLLVGLPAGGGIALAVGIERFVL